MTSIAGGTGNGVWSMSWFPHPKTSIPDSATGGSFPVMRTVVEFGRKLDAMKAEQRRGK
jgi:hypothetical protein